MTPEQTADYFNRVFANQHSRVTGRTHTFKPARKTSAKDFAKGSRSFALFSGNPALKKETSKSKKDEVVSAAPNLKGLENDPDGLQAALGDLWGGVKAVGGAVVPDQAPGAFSRALDLISRPAYGVFNALDKTGEAINQGENPWSVGDDALYGGWRGLSGQDKTGYGAVVEEFARPDSQTNRTTAGALFANILQPTQVPLRLAQQADQYVDVPGLTGGIQNYKRAMGFTGEMVGDPTNYVGFGVVNNAVKGANIGADAMGVFARNATRKAIKDATEGLVNPNSYRMIDEIVEEVGQTADRNTLEFLGGPNRGRVNTGGRTFAPTLANVGAEATRKRLLGNFEDLVQRFKDGRLSNPQALSAAKRDPLFNEFYTQFETAMAKFVKQKGPDPRFIIDDLINETRTLVDGKVLEVHDNILRGISKEVFNQPAIRVVNKRYSPPGFERMGRAYAAANKAGVRSPSAINFNRLFPGRLGLINQRARSLGKQVFDEARKMDASVARTLSFDDRKLLQEALHAGRTVDSRLQGALDYLKAEYRKIWDAEVEAGVRSADSAYSPNYAYIFNKNNVLKVDNRKTRTKFKAKRKAEIKSRPDHKSTMGVKEAEAMGLNPELDAFENLGYRRAKANRDLTRSAFTTDLLDHYGVLAKNQTKGQIENLKLTPIHAASSTSNSSYINQTLRDRMKAGETWYLPEDVADVLDHFKKLSSLDFNDEALDMLRIIDWGLNKFKFWATLPWPGFHVRNFIGDVFMGLMDGVGFQSYKRAAEVLAHTDKVYSIGKYKMTGEEILDLFRKNSTSGGYISTDITIPTKTARNTPTEMAAKLRQGIVTGSEAREDLGRLSHFIKALDDEAASGSLQNAVERATFRVNKYKFDYGALTATEKNYMRRAIPFYTYMRKIIPALTEALYLSPQYLSLVNRQKQYAKDYNQDMVGRLAPWQQQSLMFMTGGDEPMFFDDSMSPTSAMKMVDSFDPLDPLNMDNAQDFSQGLGSMLNPVIQAPFELATQDEVFSDTPITQGDTVMGKEVPALADYLLKQFVPPYSQVQSTMSRTENPDTSGLDMMAMSRLGFGLGARRLSQESQSKNLMGQVYDLKDRLNNEMNPQLEPFGLYITLSERASGTSVQVKTIEDKKILYNGDLQGALQFAENSMR